MKVYVFNDWDLEDGSGEQVFTSLQAVKDHLLSGEYDLSGLYVINEDHPAPTAVRDWDGEEEIELYSPTPRSWHGSYATIYSICPKETK